MFFAVLPLPKNLTCLLFFILLTIHSRRVGSACLIQPFTSKANSAWHVRNILSLLNEQSPNPHPSYGLQVNDLTWHLIHHSISFLSFRKLLSSAELTSGLYGLWNAGQHHQKKIQSHRVVNRTDYITTQVPLDNCTCKIFNYGFQNKYALGQCNFLSR